jgi:dihydropyrimidine dehydrogenase (NAD+) subunit PreA
MWGDSMNMQCSWLGLNLSSPLVLASLTLFSKPDVDRQTDYYIKCAQLGAGAIILPSVNPINSDHTKSFVRTEAVYSGIHPNQAMSFTVLGPTSNITTVEYIVSVIRMLKKKKITIPVLASIVNMGSKEEYLHAIHVLGNEGIQGVELNFSCPNVLSSKKDELDLTVKLLREVKQIINNLPITIKLSPDYNFQPLLSDLSDEIHGFTLSNANIGLLPPKLDNPFKSFSPFPYTEKWSPTGVYGPHERLSTLNTLYKFVISQNVSHKCFDVSSVGGYLMPEHAIQAIMLGADTVQLSSVLAWKGIGSFKKFYEIIKEYLCTHKYSQINDLKGIALPFISLSADDAVSTVSQDIIMQVGEECCECPSCGCCDKMCYAIVQPSPNKAPYINPNLCSGCGWCRQHCPHNAIHIIVPSTGIK